MTNSKRNMPLHFHRHLNPEGEMGLWHITESAEYFESRLSLLPSEKAQLAELKGHRRLEWLAGRWLLHEMSGREERGACLKDEHGKPYLEGSLYEISISHSREMAAIMAAPRAVGIDIQKLVGKIERIAHKYMREEESASLQASSRLVHLHVYWGAKEALYKAYGRRQLDFKAHIHISPFSFDPKGGSMTGQIIKGDFREKYEIFYEQFDDYILVHAMEDIGDQRLASRLVLV